MGVSYELKISTQGNSQIKKLNSLLEELSNAGEIDILAKSCQEDGSFKISFRFTKWFDLTTQGYLATKEFKSAIPVATPSLKDIEKELKKKLLEAAEAEYLASKLIVTIDANLERFFFQIHYADTMVKIQSEQVGFYLQQQIQSTFRQILHGQQLHPLSITID